MSKKLKPLTIFLSDDELVNFKSHFDEFLNMNCDDKIKEQQQEIERLNNIIKGLDNTIENLEEVIKHKDSIIKEVREYIEERYNGEVLTHTFDNDNVGELLEILKGEYRE